MIDYNKSGGPAFPRPCSKTEQFEDRGAAGMTMIDYFAGQALSGVLNAMHIQHMEPMLTQMMKADGVTAEAALAAVSYRMADAMLAEREKRQ